MTTDKPDHNHNVNPDHAYRLLLTLTHNKKHIIKLKDELELKTILNDKNELETKLNDPD